jgi:7-carboxy-7-deazaguanine synthase
LRCTYCDTEYAFFEGKDMTFAEILKIIESFQCPLVEITGGEPLIQKNVIPLMQLLCDKGYEVLLETAGHFDISHTDPRVKKIMDIKCPSSGETEKMLWSNIAHITDRDEIKFVVGNQEDLDWAKEIIDKYDLCRKCNVLFSPVFGKLDNLELAKWLLQNHLPARMQIQLHKLIWEPHIRGV